MPHGLLIRRLSSSPKYCASAVYSPAGARLHPSLDCFDDPLCGRITASGFLKTLSRACLKSTKRPCGLPSSKNPSWHRRCPWLCRSDLSFQSTFLGNLQKNAWGNHFVGPIQVFSFLRTNILTSQHRYPEASTMPISFGKHFASRRHRAKVPA